MKRIFLLMLSALSLIVHHASAQTDVTSQYLINAGFEGNYDVYSYPRNDGDNARAIYKPEGWTVTYTNGESNDLTSLNSSCLQWNNFSGREQPADGGSNVYWIRYRWGSNVSIKLSQLVQLPAGTYRLSADAFWLESPSMATISAGGQSVTVNSRNTWAKYAVFFTLTSSSDVEIAYTFTQNSQAECIAGVDNFKLEKYDGSETDMTSSVSNSTDAWTNPLNAPNHNATSVDGMTMPERWFSWIPVGEIMSQSVNLPNGVYEAEVYCHGHVAWVSSPVSSSGATGYTTLSANGVTSDIPVILNTGWEENEPTFYKLSNIPVVDGKMTIRLTANKAGANWFTIYVKSLTRVGSLPSLRYTIGDVNEDEDVTIADVTSLVNIILGKTSDYRMEVADVNEDGDVTIADVTSLVNVILGKQEAKVVDLTWTCANISATLYAEQSASENASGASYAMNSAVCTLTGENVSDKYSDIKNYLTTLNITTSLSNVKSVSVYAKGKENIAGLMTYNTYTKAATYSSGTTPSAYVNSDRDDVNGKNMQSDVVTVTGDNAGTYVAYLLPISLSSGVTVTVRDSNGKFYSQDFSVTAGAINNLAFTATSATNNWMATIPGNVNFSMLSTPGAHNAATSAISSSQAKCQSETIEGLLNNGVRAFDLRPQYKSGSTITADNLTIYHGSISTGVLYKDVIQTIAVFLQAHPTEAISIIMTKESASGSDQTDAMVSAINEIHNTYANYFKVLDHSYYTLDDYRGKIFYGCRPAQDLTGAVRVTNWPDDKSVSDYSVGVGGTCSASVEDEYNSKDDAKKSAVNTMLNLASGNTNRSRFHFTFTSVAWSLLGASITGQANTQNPAAASYISGTLIGPAGYVYADFMGSASYSGQALLKAVIEQNYKYVFKGRSRME